MRKSFRKRKLASGSNWTISIFGKTNVCGQSLSPVDQNARTIEVVGGASAHWCLRSATLIALR